ncbi:MAG: hypothetical protein HGB11_13155, partial [Chlorobiales bacterium]|nr:hypothetical protein [Chlorobiales bacterium]
MSLVQRDAGAKLVDDLKINADWTASLAAYESVSPGKLQPVYNPSIFQTAPSAFKKADDKTFYADDLVRGYAVDVWDSETKKWRTLCKRKGSYKLGSQFLDLDNGTLTINLIAHSDESCIEASLIGDPNNEEEKQHLIETLFRWEGWSLVAPRPGKSIDEANTPQTINTEKEAALGLTITVAPEPGTLPRLRFGRSYRFRLRALDIAGNSKKLEDLGDSDFSTASPTEFFQRYEPVLSPTLIFRNKQKPGESIEHCVIRSNYNQTTEKYKEDYELDEFLSERHFVAPKTSQIMSELHGKFDSMEASDAYKLIVSRDADFPKPPSVNGQLGSNPVIMDELISLPYLPDPLVQGAMLAFYDRYDKAVGQPVKIDFYPNGKSWPDPVSFRLKVVEGTDAPSWNEGSRILTAYVAKAEYLKVRYSSVISETQLDIFGVWNWIKNRNPGNLGDLRKIALSGKHWMLSPSREIILLHAVQQPLKEPVIDKLVPSKTLGSTFALLSGSLLSDAKSTTKLDMLAEWKEQIDDPDSGQEPKTVTGNAHVFDFLLEDTALNDKYLFGNQNREPQQPGGYIPTDLINLGQIQVDKAVYIDKADVDKLIVTDIKPISSSSYPKVNPAIQPENQSGQQFKIQGLHQVKTFSLTQADDQRHEFGDTKYRKVRYKVSANTRFREYFLDFKKDEEFPPDFPLVRDSAVKEVRMLSSARPAAPKPLYILPTFSWEKKTDGKNIISRRFGNV